MVLLRKAGLLRPDDGSGLSRDGFIVTPNLPASRTGWVVGGKCAFCGRQRLAVTLAESLAGAGPRRSTEDGCYALPPRTRCFCRCTGSGSVNERRRARDANVGWCGCGEEGWKSSHPTRFFCFQSSWPGRVRSESPGPPPPPHTHPHINTHRIHRTPMQGGVARSAMRGHSVDGERAIPLCSK